MKINFSTLSYQLLCIIFCITSSMFNSSIFGEVTHASYTVYVPEYNEYWDFQCPEITDATVRDLYISYGNVYFTSKIWNLLVKISQKCNDDEITPKEILKELVMHYLSTRASDYGIENLIRELSEKIQKENMPTGALSQQISNDTTVNSTIDATIQENITIPKETTNSETLYTLVMQLIEQLQKVLKSSKIN